MPTIADTLGSDGALVRVEIGISQRRRHELFAARSPVPPPLTMTGLIDTGAEMTCIDARAARRLGLSPRRGATAVNVPGAGGLTLTLSYDVDLTVLHPSGNSADHLVVTDLEVADVALNVFRIDVLLGRDLLARCDFNYLGRSGTFSLTY
jgi:Aspartyl protease